jgi:protein tyrosine phosphatase (PTP) superfamily phosphohydrolase (DUF442 family)
MGKIMSNRCGCWLVLLVALLSGGCATVGQRVEGIANFDTVESPAPIYRGAQPSVKGIATLQSMGVRTVINLRDDPPAWEEQAVVSAGMNYIWIPTSPLREDPGQIRAFLRAMQSAERPLFIHCLQGRDRTGLEVAIYRLTHRQSEWTRERVIQDLRAHGYNWMLFPGIERYIRSTDFAALALSLP